MMRHAVQGIGRHEIDMCGGPVFTGMARFALPLALSSLLQLLFNAADVIVIGHLGSPLSLAAVGAAGVLTGLFANLLQSLAVGATVLASKFLGSGKRGEVPRVLHVSVALALVCGTALTVAMYFFVRPIMVLLRTPDEVLGLALRYLYFYLAGLPGVALYNFGAAMLRAKGDTRRPLYFLVAAGVVNVLLNLFFVIVLRMDVAGVALATTISQYVSVALLFACLARENDEFRFDVRRMGFDWYVLAQILRIGIPSAFQCFVFYLSNLVIQASINSFGPVAMAGNAAAGNIELFVWVCMGGFEQAGMTFVSQNFGAGNLRRVDRVNALSLLSVFTIGMVLGNVVSLCGRPLLHIYTPDEAAVTQGLVRMHLICGTYGLCGVMDVLACNLRGLGRSLLPSVVSMVGVCGLRLLWVFTLFRQDSFHTLPFLFLTYPVSWAVTALVHAACYLAVRRRLARRYRPAGA